MEMLIWACETSGTQTAPASNSANKIRLFIIGELLKVNYRSPGMAAAIQNSKTKDRHRFNIAREMSRHCKEAPLSIPDNYSKLMLHIIWSIIVGFIIGLIARAIMPGAQHLGFIMTTVIGIVGSIL